MSTLSTYLTGLTYKLAQSSTAFFTEPMRIAAINEAITKLTESYEIPDLVIRSSLTFSSGTVAIPSNFQRMIKMWDTSTEATEYTYLINDIFDNIITQNQDTKYWTIDYSTTTSTRRFYVNPDDTTTVYVRYLKNPTTLSVGGDESGVSSYFDDAIAYWSAAILFKNSGDYPKSQTMELASRQAIQMAFQSVVQVGGRKQHARVRSVYESVPILTQTNTP